MSASKQKVAVAKSIETGDSGPAGYFHPPDTSNTIQGVADGLQGFVAYYNSFRRVRPVNGAGVSRLDYVFAPTTTTFSPENRLRHFPFRGWPDRLNTGTTSENSAGAIPAANHDDATAARGFGQNRTEQQLVRRFVEDIPDQRRYGETGRLFDAIVHPTQPQIGDGLSRGLGEGAEALAQQGITKKYGNDHKVRGEGDFVLVAARAALPASLHLFTISLELKAARLPNIGIPYRQIRQANRGRTIT